MAEGNGQNHEARISVLEQARKEMEDALLVTSQLEARQSRLIKELANEQDAQRAEQKAARERSAALDARIDKLVSSIGELISRIPPENLR